MGRLIRSLFALVGVVAFLLSLSAIFSGLISPPGQRGPLIGFGLGMAAFSALFVWMLQKPFFNK